METLQWESVDKNEFTIFMRDLSQHTSINLKHMIEDLNTETRIISAIEKKKKHNHNNKYVIKKKDLIIAEQKKRRYEKEIQNDKKTIEFLFQNVNDKDPYLGFEKLKTEECKLDYQCMLLEKYWNKKKKNLSHVFNLYYHLVPQKDKIDERYLTILTRIEKVLSEYDCKSFMLQKLGHLLPPLDFWSQGVFTFDEWQKETIQKIYQKKSIIVKAPTSSGKTFIAMATGIIYKKILYVCPAKPVAYQVGSKFIKMGYKVHYYIENHSHFSYDENTNIFIGTPDCIEDNLTKIANNFDYAVFDEIHTLGSYQSYENIIKCINCNFLALSATIENIDYLKDIFAKIHPTKTIEYIEYKKKFMNQQRWIMNEKKIEKLHPCVCLESQNLESFQETSFTPNDCYTLYEALETIFEPFYETDETIEDRIDEMSPDNYYQENRILTLDDVKEYEFYLKRNLSELQVTYPEQIQMLQSHFNKEITSTETLDDMVIFLKECEKKDFLPMLYFHTEGIVSKEIFIKLYHLLNDKEKLNYPYHYDILEKKQTYYEEYKTKLDIFASNISIKTKDALTEKESKLNQFEKDNLSKYTSFMINYYEKCIEKSKGCKNEKKVIENLKKELSYFIQNPDLCGQDIFKKHPDYCFTRGDPMSGQEIKSIRREIRKATGITISYENPVFQLLKRGIGLYIESMPDAYNWILQKLMTDKKLGIIISDRTLCLGIDLPIRSVALSGYKNPNYTVSDYLQMSGRAGRRGLDNQGNIIFHNVPNYRDLMKGKSPHLQLSEKKVTHSYNILNQINHRISTKNILPYEKIECSLKLEKLLWSLRKYEKNEIFSKECVRMEKVLFMEIESDREYKLVDIITDSLLDKECIYIYKSNKIESKDELVMIESLGEITRNMVNTLDTYSYKITKESAFKIFERCKKMIFTNKELE